MKERRRERERERETPRAQLGYNTRPRIEKRTTRADLIYANTRTQRFQSKLHFPLSGPYRRLLLAATRHYAQYVKISTSYAHTASQRARKSEKEREQGEERQVQGKEEETRRRASLRAHENCMENKLLGQRESIVARELPALWLSRNMRASYARGNARTFIRVHVRARTRTNSLS